MSDPVRITFGMIVLNGEPFTAYNLRALYPYAHEIIVVEGACPAARNIATSDGHSRDCTLDVLKRFKTEEDPDNKLQIVTAEDEGHPDGFWTEKDEMSQAYAKRATGDYLWQVDVDEFYLESDICKVMQLMSDGVDTFTFKAYHFWGGLHYIVDGVKFISEPSFYHRIFAWGPGYCYTKHRPPTVVDSECRDLRTKRYLDASKTQALGIFMRHYCLLLPKQVEEKCEYYSNVGWIAKTRMNEWAKNNYTNLKNPYRVHNDYDELSWLKTFEGEHPAQIQSMMIDIAQGDIEVVTRPTEDIERLVRNRVYWFTVLALSLWAYFLGTSVGMKYRHYVSAIRGHVVRMFRTNR